MFVRERRRKWVAGRFLGLVLVVWGDSKDGL